MAEDYVVMAAQPATMQAVYQAHVRAIYAFIYTRVGNREAAEDLTSDVFLKALTRLDPAREEHSVVAWLFRVARNAVTDYWRGAHAAVVIPFEETRSARYPSRGPGATAYTHEQAIAQARTILGQLPDQYRAVLVCRVLEGLSVAETAQRLGTSAANVKVVQHRALRRAAQLREDDGNGE